MLELKGIHLSLKKAVENWVRADFEFRFGEHRYSDFTQALYLRTEEELRKILTGKSDLVAARIVLRRVEKGRTDAKNRL